MSKACEERSKAKCTVYAVNNVVLSDPKFKPYLGTVASGFNFKQFNSNVVLRWEYRPGSTLFVVWTQGRGDFLGGTGTRSLAGDFRDLFGLHPENTFLVKASYWLNW